MKKAAYNILPRTEDILKTMGEQIKLARLSQQNWWPNVRESQRAKQNHTQKKSWQR